MIERMSCNLNHVVGTFTRNTAGIQRLGSSSSSVHSIRNIHLTPLVKQQQTSQKPESSRVLRDENIKARRVRLVDPQTNELMPGPFNTAELLRSIDRTRYTLQQVAPGKSVNSTQKPPIAKKEEEPSTRSTRDWRSRGKPSISQEDDASFTEPEPVKEEQSPITTLDDLPIVKLVDKKAEYDKKRLAKKQKQGSDVGEESTSGGTAVKSATTLHKNIVLSWQSTTHDIQHKLLPIRANMIKRGTGASCTITIASKKGKGSAVDEEGKLAFLNNLETFLSDWSNAASILEEDGTQPSEAKKLQYFPRRRGEVQWQKNNKTAILIMEVARR
ncbi:uncharacterized protein FA14DRAFT_159113 [Meira miltonrushii]|uniref:Uncharacterized protein n=1 Tax=Meira miltonrushii TaxID=1280837 RepID=A0A316VGF0_9BASI|nr:uncharacterized protein FA14DRAFT_159113 [Meira miltonrushii]PWN36709.1 hypothetical protein FA14DRAFT_159113 [Meira miltonrushii]